MLFINREAKQQQEPELTWQNNANCLGVDPEVFGMGALDGIGNIEEAKRFCGACAVRKECLGYALMTNQKWGTWGGYTTEERVRL